MTEMKDAKRYEYTDEWGNTMTIFFARGEYQVGGNLFIECLCEYCDKDYDEVCPEAYSPVTLNFGDFGPCGSNEAYVDSNNSKHLIEWLVGKGFASYTGEWLRSGFCEYPQVRFSEKFLAGTANNSEG